MLILNIFIDLAIYYSSHYNIIYWRENCWDFWRFMEVRAAVVGPAIDQDVVQIPLAWGLRHVLYFSTNGEAYQVFDCNVVLRLMKTGWRHRETWTLSTPKPEEGLVWVEVCSCVPSPELVQPKRRKNSSRPAGTPYVSKCGLSSQSQGGVWATFLLILSEDKKNSECSIINHHPWLSLHVTGDTHKIFFYMITDEFL